MCMATRRVTVLLSEHEYTQVRTSANGIPLSRWFRTLALAGKEAHASPLPDVQSKPAIRADERRESMPSRSVIARLAVQIPGLKPASELPSKRTCKHGKAKGFNCWQCGGLAQVESAS